MRIVIEKREEKKEQKENLEQCTVKRYLFQSERRHSVCCWGGRAPDKERQSEMQNGVKKHLTW